MGVLVIKYVQLICVAFFVKNSNCAPIDKEVASHLKISACIAECLNVNRYSNNSKVLENCMNDCSEANDRILNYEALAESSNFSLYCRDTQSLLIKIDHEVSEAAVDKNETFVYMLKVKESTGKFTDRIYSFSDESLINVTIHDPSLAETTTLSYEITAYIISSKNSTVQMLGKKNFTTLMPDFKPEPVTEDMIFDLKWIEYFNKTENDQRLNLTFKWLPERSHTCYYNVLFYGSTSIDSLDIESYPVPIGKLYEYTMSNLRYDSEYYVAIRAVNKNKPDLYSQVQWKEISSPENENKFEIKTTLKHVSDNNFDVKITWNEPSTLPNYYRVELKNLHAHTRKDYTADVKGTEKFYLFKNIELTSLNIFINVTGFGPSNNIHVHDYAFINRQIIPQSKVINILFYIFVALVVILFLFLFKVWKGRIDSFISIFAQKRIDDLDIEIVKTMSTGTVLDAIAELTKDEKMEIERENITVLQLIGEGAFGLVKKGLIIKNGEKQYVAVKMIKNTSNLEDIKQFHQEISVMKSVGQHENIVSIVGHCTSDINELMLLTEYCDDGSLLDLLRLEFAKQFKFYDTKGKLNASVQITMEKYSDSLLNFDMSERDKKEISYKNIGCSATPTAFKNNKLFVVNQMYDELNNNIKNESFLKAIEMTATNALYLKLNEQDTQTTNIIIDEEDSVIEFLTSSDLLSFAKQICDGMDFLARKKVVHRDLAARNILVCSNKTVKISDFGLSRDIYQDLVYRKTGNGKLPIKWLALESMTHQVYTSQSDVWSFGVLLYEIVTLGCVPYSSINVENLLKFLRSGFRMERPSHCHILLYELMMLCWHANPMNRPSFDELSLKLNEFLLMENWGERIIDLSKMFTKCMNDVNYMKPLI
ncbi:hypothetical protein PVAND_003427 [Polypedilum vanderplanki]|uniref:receptor protein-tyrosine kinase n=1 Tax=Polypedilum vanderplanki TaxID=319348 RepID=A0A9J6BV25_POLVA|nr:hypothetical protein PVAND_003427 [Polypedilum vanderplanki]